MFLSISPSVNTSLFYSFHPNQWLAYLHISQEILAVIFIIMCVRGIENSGGVMPHSVRSWIHTRDGQVKSFLTWRYFELVMTCPSLFHTYFCSLHFLKNTHFPFSYRSSILQNLVLTMKNQFKLNYQKRHSHLYWIISPEFVNNSIH